MTYEHAAHADAVAAGGSTDWLPDYERKLFHRPGRAHVNIQWKGTRLCADVHCQCGTYSHVDGYCFGEWICRGCQKGFKLAWTAVAYEVEPESHMNVTTEEGDL